MPGKPVDDVTRARIVELALAGELSRNMIAREVGVAGQTVTRICAEAGVTFDQSLTELAVRARSLDAAKLRAELAVRMLIRSAEALDDMTAPTTTGHWTNSTETSRSEYLEHVTDGPTISDRRNLMTIAAIGFQRAGELLDKNDTTKVDQGVSVLRGLQAALAAGADALAQIDPTAVPDPADAREQYADYLDDGVQTAPESGAETQATAEQGDK